jgi:hypothetical protein
VICTKNIIHMSCIPHMHGHNRNVIVSCYCLVDGPKSHLNRYSVIMMHSSPFPQSKYGYA